MNEFKKNTNRRANKDSYTINCKKGLWGVTAATKEEAMREALRYFVQYYEDGEYDTTKG